MSTRFFTNQGDQTLLRKFRGVFESNADIEWFDALVGYLRASGYFANRAPETTSDHLATCLEKTAGGFRGDQLPWRLALQFCRHNPRGMSGREDLTANLDHHNSSIRLWMFKLAWCVRNRLDPVEATVRLLKNLAATLGYWDPALGLCWSLYPAGEPFWAMADNFQAKEFAAQYRKRMDYARKQGSAVFQNRFVQLELRLRRLISQAALALTADEIKGEPEATG